MKKLVPLLIALLGLGTGVGAGIALKPAPEAVADACAAPASGEVAAGAGHGEATAEAAPAANGKTAPAAHGEGAPEATAAAAPCPPADPFAPETVADEGHGKASTEVSYVPIEKPFIVPIFAGEKTVAMVVMSLSIATEGEKAATEVEAIQPRLRDSFLKVMFRHANSGGFDGSYTTGRKIEDLKSALLGAAREVLHDAPVDEVLITEIARQDS